MYIELLAKAITLDEVYKKLRRDFILCFELPPFHPHNNIQIPLGVRFEGYSFGLEK